MPKLIAPTILKDLEIAHYFIEEKNNEAFEEVALLYAIQAFEKSLRIKYYDSYRYIFKIKFSVLIDKYFQDGFLSPDEYSLMKDLKNFRNHQLHLPDENPHLIEEKISKALSVYHLTLKLWGQTNI